jgi:hypothetical protein
MGYSAGGDAAYQIPARVPDRWAAVAMSAGHPNGVSMANLANVPFLIQVGELDAAYNRNMIAAEYSVNLDALARRYPGWYRHDCFIHQGQGHNFMDHDPRGAPQTVYADPAQWLVERDQASTCETDANSIHWLDQFTRESLPRAVIWECQTTANRSGTKTPGFWPTIRTGSSNYWLSLENFDSDTPFQKGSIVAECDREANTVTFSEIGNHVEILLHETQIDLLQTVRVTVEGHTLERKPEPRLSMMIRTLLDRGDPNYIFPAAFSLIKNPEGDWLLETAGH